MDSHSLRPSARRQREKGGGPTVVDAEATPAAALLVQRVSMPLYELIGCVLHAVAKSLYRLQVDIHKRD